MTFHSELHANGWVCIQGVTTKLELLQLARSIGNPVPSPTGELIKELSPKPAAEAHTDTFSATYATNSFPLHTDTAFWPRPCRYIVMRVRGDCRRPTTALTFEKLFDCVSPDLRFLAYRSVWRIRTRSRSFYCSMRFRINDIPGWRYDSTCMIPANDAAASLRTELAPFLEGNQIEQIHWARDTAIVLDNWTALHGRGPSPNEEQLRILERIYVE
jgi:hypothetical protein